MLKVLLVVGLFAHGVVVTGVSWCGVGVENEIIGVDVDMAKRSGELSGVVEVAVNKIERVMVRCGP